MQKARANCSNDRELEGITHVFSRLGLLDLFNGVRCGLVLNIGSIP